ncbi:MAG: acyl-CoA/acyl-ACP dehydrogenase [Chthonomonas sp.]|nr:acyl-CoA/acyl-ACP dehydrogenase [Chthonomonas sp.]
MPVSRLMKGAEEFLTNQVSPLANAMDTDSGLLHGALNGLCEAGLICLRRPAEFGGPGFVDRDFRDFQELVARHSGALAFLQTQHQSAVSLLSKGEPSPLRDQLLHQAHQPDELIGIGFSQLRRAGPPVLRAEATAGGYRIDGHLPWATGFGMFRHLLLAAALPDGTAVFGVIPFESAPGVQYSEPMRLAAMQAAQTVTAEFDGYQLDASKVLFLREPNWIHRNDMINVTLQGFFAIGCARAGLELAIGGASRRKSTDALRDLASLEGEMAQCRDQLGRSQALGDETTDERLQLRAWAIDLMLRCTSAAIVATGGAANSTDHAAQRVYREAMVFAVSAQTTQIMLATLSRLAAR